MTHDATEAAGELDWRLVFEAAPAPLLLLTPELVIVGVSQAYLQATRRGRDELIGRGVFEAFPDNSADPADPAATGARNLRASLERVRATRTVDVMPVQRYDIPVGTAESAGFEERHWLPVNAPVLDDHGRLRAMVHRVEDVTAQVQAQSRAAARESTIAAQAVEIEATHQRLRQSRAEAQDAARQAEAERRLVDAVLRHAPVGILVVDPMGQLVRSNPEALRLGGAVADPGSEPSTRFGKREGWWADRSSRHGQRVRAHEWPLARALQGEAVSGETVEIARPADQEDGRAVVLISAAPIIDSDGRVSGAVSAVMDITDRVAAEDALRDSVRRKDEFLAMLAHELRNPLAPIGAAADLLAMGRLGADQARRTSAIIARQVRHMAGIVDDLLDVSRVTRGLVQLDQRVLDLREAVHDAVEQVRPALESRNHRFSIRTAAQQACVRGDPKRLVQVFGNLLQNAARYTPPGGDIALTLAVRGGEVEVAVADNGIGMTAAFTRHCFDLFAQAERSADRAQGGLGIGLALVRSLVEQHGGSVSAHSPGPGQGSRFVVRLPLSHEPAPERPLRPAEPPPAPRRALDVLVVDDNADAAQMLALLVEALGHRSTVENDSRAALERALRQPPDACLLDLGLPDMDGLQLAARLRADPRTAGARLIAVTGYGQEQDRQAASQAGFDHHLVKPVDSTRLAQLLQDASA